MVGNTFDVVFVCTGNRFRSPLAAAAFAATATDQPIRVHSLGMLERRGEPALAEALRVGASFGLDLTIHRSRTLGDLDLADMDLVIGFERKHIVGAAVDGHARPEKSFLLLELVGILDSVQFPPADDVVERARQAVALADAYRGTQTWTQSIADPWGGSAVQYEQTAAHVRDLSTRLGGQLFGTEGD